MNEVSIEEMWSQFLNRPLQDRDSANETQYVDELKRLLGRLEQVVEDRSNDIAEASFALATIYRHQGQFEESRKLYERSASILNGTNTSADPMLKARVLTDISSLYAEQGQLERAAEYRQDALCVLIAQLGDSSPQVLQERATLAMFYMILGKLKEASQLYKVILATKLHILGKKHLQVSAVLADLALVSYLLERFLEAQSYIQRAIQTRLELVGEDETVASYLNLQGLILCAQGKHKDAQPLCRKASEIRSESNDKDCAAKLNELADYYCEQDRFDDAQVLCHAAFRQRERHLPLESPRKNLDAYLMILRDTNQDDEAECILRRMKNSQ